MKPKGATEHEDGLLEYLEDIIGTSKYKQPIEDAQVRLDQINEARGERLGRLKLVEREKSGLEVRTCSQTGHATAPRRTLTSD
jgi:structural maintenance of chromosome 4